MTLTHIHLALHIPTPVPELIIYATRLANALDGNVHVPNPTPTVADFRAHIADLTTKQAQVKTLGTGERDAAEQIVINDVKSIGRCGQAAIDANPSQATIIAQSLGLPLDAPHGPHGKDAVHISSPTPGTIVVRVKAADKPAAYEFRISHDKGVTYVAAGVSSVAEITISGLTIGETVMVQYRITIGQTPGPWSDAVSFVVH